MKNVVVDITGCKVNFLSLRLRNEHQFFSFVGIVHTRGSIKTQEKESLKLFKNSILSPEDFSYILTLTGMGCLRAYSFSCFQFKIRYFPANFQDKRLNCRLSEKSFRFLFAVLTPK